MQLVFMITENYLGRARIYMSSLHHLTNVKITCICLGFDFGSCNGDLRESFPYIDFQTMPRHWSESSTGIMQHGRWLDALPEAPEDDLYILTDADIVVQRDFTPDERQFFDACDRDSFLAGWNACSGDTLAEEGKRIELRPGTLFDLEKESIPCFNTGVLAMRGGSWKRLCSLYESCCEHFYQFAAHKSRGQWLICWCLWRLGLKPILLQQNIHCHGHFDLPKDVDFINGNVARWRGEVVLFKHNMA